MNYKELEKIMESIEVAEEKEYNPLIGESGMEEKDELFLDDIGDKKVKDDDKKILCTACFVEQPEKETESENIFEEEEEVASEDYLSDDSVREYLKEMSKIPLLTPEEEVRLTTELYNFEKQLKQNHITDKYLEESLKKLDFKDEVRKDKNSIKKQIAYVTKLQSDKKNQLELAKKHLTSNSSQADETILKQVTDLLEQLEEIDKLKQDLNMALNYRCTFDKICEANLRLVVSVAKRYTGRGMSFLDLIQEGNIGLTKGIEKFDVTKGYKLSTYATWWIRQSVTRALADQGRTIRIPVHMHESILKLKMIKRKLESELGRKPTEEEIAPYINYTKDEIKTAEAQREENLKKKKPGENIVDPLIQIGIEKIKEMEIFDGGIRSLDEPIVTGREDGDDSILGEFVAAENSTPEELSELSLLKEALDFVFQESPLTNREKEVIRCRFGLDDGEEKTLQEVGEKFGVTRERIRQIELKALGNLRNPRYIKYLEGFYNYNQNHRR